MALEVGGVELRRAAVRTARKAPGDAPVTAAAGAVPFAPARRAVVAVLGHVDHGKTTLLDCLRHTSVAAREAGGITQHMGAFVVALPGDGGSLTFLDTPGHAAFTAMRARGAACTDIVVLVVAADDGVMPQTREALAHARAAGCPIVVALTKCDKASADVGKARRQLLEEGLATEDAGGSVQVVEVAALSGAGLDALSEALLLEADGLDLRGEGADGRGEGEGVVLEARLDRGQGPLAMALLRRGSIQPGCALVAGTQWGRVRALRDASGAPLAQAGPSEPVEVVGLRGLPQAGDPIQVVASEERARRIAGARAERAARGVTWGTPTSESPSPSPSPSQSPRGKAARRAARVEAAAADALSAEAALLPDAPRELALLIKADVQGTAEALRDAVEGLSSAAVRVRALHCGVGPVSENDVALAAACGAPILAFNVRTAAAADAEARRCGVTVASRRVIYHLLDDVGVMLTGLAPEHEAEEVAGEADVLQLFALPAAKKGGAAAGGGSAQPQPPVAGCRVRTGSITLGERFRLLRDGVAVHEGLLSCASIRRHRLEVQTVGRGTECGVVLTGWTDVRSGDVLQCVRTVRVRARTEEVQGGGLRVTDQAGDVVCQAP